MLCKSTIFVRINKNTSYMELIIDYSRLYVFSFWVVCAYAVVFISMLIDLLSAFVRCRRVGEKWVSDKMKRTAAKAEKYFLPMLALSVIDILVFIIVKYPVFTLVLALINSLTEWKSVFEHTHTKEEQREAARTISVIVKNKDEIAKVLEEIINKGGSK